MNPELSNSLERIGSEPKTIEELLTDYDSNQEKGLIDVSLIEFDDLKNNETVGGLTRKIKTLDTENLAVQIDRYNPSRAFWVQGKMVTAIRVESRGLENDSRVEFFELDNAGMGRLIEDAPVLENCQDPFYEGEIHGLKIFGVVKIEEDKDTITYKTEFFRFKDNLKDMEKFAEGPVMMKDIRLTELPSGKIAVFVRPQAGDYGRGQIGYMEIDGLDNLEENLKNFESQAKIFDNLFYKDEWGGVNDIHILKNGKIGLIGHIAHFAQENGQETNLKEYFATAAVFDGETQEILDLKIILTEEDVEKKLGISIERKHSNLKSVLYPGGSERKDDGTMTFYAGVGDTRAVVFKTKDPFLEYESD